MKPGAKTVAAALAAALLAAATTLLLRTPLREARSADGVAVVTLKFVHTNLQSGVREAFDAIARQFEAKNPGVQVEQIPVPARLYPVWIETKLLDGLAPDLVMLSGGSTAISSERTLRMFVPLARFVDEPNPHNAGTPLEGLPWRETFIDGLTSEPAYSSNLINVFGIPYTLSTTRIVCNATLLREITGKERLPQTWGEFLSLCERVRSFARQMRRPIEPLAASQASLDYLSFLYGSQTQRFDLERVAQPHRLETFSADLMTSYLSGTWRFEDPAVRSGLSLVREFGRQAQPGFLQLSLGDAQFAFLQGRALMIPSTSADASSLRAQARFPLVAFRLPLPSGELEDGSTGALGAPNEGTGSGLLAFGLTRTSAHPELAIDFLRFLTSVAGATRFAERSGWLPAVVGLEVGPDLRPFLPELGGFRNGQRLDAGSDTAHLYRSSLNRLFAADGGVDDFIDALEQGYAQAAAADIGRITRAVLNNAVVYDSVFGGIWELEHSEPDPSGERARRIGEIVESQTFQEEASYLRRHLLEKHSRSR